MAFNSYFNRRRLAGALALGASLWASCAIAADDAFPTIALAADRWLWRPCQ